MATGGNEDSDKFNGNQKEKYNFNGEDENVTKNVNAEPENSEESKKLTNRDENPFSFKKFLKAADGNQTNGFRASSNRIINLDLANDLPDFVQGHYNSSECDSNRLISNPIDGNLPDFALHDANKSLGARPKIYNRVLPMFNNNNISIENHEDSHTNSHPANVPDNCSNSLPDFLSDSGIGPTCIRESSNTSSDALASLKLHNVDLVKRLDELTQALDSERERNHRLTQRLSRMKQDEASNHEVIHSQSAVGGGEQAEDKTDSSLANQIKLLQNQVETLQMQRSMCTCNNDSQKQLVQASQRVTTVAEDVQSHLRHLMSSVEELKMASALVLASCTTTSTSTTSGCPTQSNPPQQQ